MGKRGPKPTEIPHVPTPHESLEAFCCAQIARIEQRLWYRYGMDAPNRDSKRTVIPQNDHITRLNLAECFYDHKR